VTSETQWQPVRIAPETEILKHHDFTRYGRFAGQIIRVRPWTDLVAFELNGGIGHGLPPCGAAHVFLVHPEDALRLSDGERDFIAVCEHQIQAD
jgi:hypothetical protein